jgi:integrase/recombinase XerD
VPRKNLVDSSPEVLRRADLKTIHLGRRPFTAALKYYQAFQEVNLSKKTLLEDMKRLKRFATFFEDLHARGGCKTADPRGIDEPAILEFLVMMKKKELKSSTQSTDIKVLNRMLNLFGNDVIVKMKKNPMYKFPKEPRDLPISALEPEELKLVFDTTYNLRGWSGQAFRGYLALAFATASRPNETLMTLVEDLDIQNRLFYIRHPKGEETWGEPQWVNIIREDMIPYLEELMRNRERMLIEYGLSSQYLFVNPGTGEPYSDKAMRGLKSKVQEMSGIHFMIKDMRSSFASLTVNNHLDRLNAVSEQLRHSTPETTRKYYARINRRKAVKIGLQDTWKESEIK